MVESFFCFRNYNINLCYDSRAHGFGIPGEIFFEIIITVQECAIIILSNVRGVHSMIYFNHT
jgi:hypothetical protein